MTGMFSSERSLVLLSAILVGIIINIEMLSFLYKLKYVVEIILFTYSSLSSYLLIFPMYINKCVLLFKLPLLKLPLLN